GAVAPAAVTSRHLPEDDAHACPAAGPGRRRRPLAVRAGARSGPPPRGAAHLPCLPPWAAGRRSGAGRPPAASGPCHAPRARRRGRGPAAEAPVGLRRTGGAGLAERTRPGVLTTPTDPRARACTAGVGAGEAAVARADTACFLDACHMGRRGERCILVNAPW